MKTIVDEIIVAPGHRVLVTADMHGRLDYFEGLLKQVNFNREDALIIVGDLLQRGYENLKLLHRVMELCRTTATYVVSGNNDAKVIELMDDDSPDANAEIVQWDKTYRWWHNGSFFGEAAEALGYDEITADNVAEIKTKIRERFPAELRFLRGLPTILDAGSYRFVHAGMEEIPKEQWESKDGYDFVKFDNFYETDIRLKVPTFVGHWPVSNYSDKIMQMSPIMDYDRNILSIDGGTCIKASGQLNMVVLPDISSRDYEISYYDPHPWITLLEDQQASEDPVYVRWVDRQVQYMGEDPLKGVDVASMPLDWNPLEGKGEWSEVRHLRTGKIMKVPTKNLFVVKGELCCNDYSDYYLEIKAGERVQLEETGPEGTYLVKKNGVIGWYRGAVAGV